MQAFDFSHLPVPWRYLHANSFVLWEKLQSLPRWQFCVKKNLHNSLPYACAGF